MFRSYFYLLRFIIENSFLAKGFTIVEAFSQQKDTLVFRLLDDSQNDLFLEISVNPQLPYIILKNSYSRARKNTITLYEDKMPMPIKHLKIAQFDRIIRFGNEVNEFVFSIRGNKSNIFHYDNSGIIPFLKSNSGELNDISNDLKCLNFTNECKHDFIENNNYEISTLRKTFPFISKEMTTELQFRYETNVNNLQLINIIEEVLFGKILVSSNESEVHFCPLGYKTFPSTQAELFDNYNEALQFYLKEKYFSDHFFSKKNLIAKHLDSELSKTVKRINNSKAVIDNGSREEEYNRIGNLLLINLYSIKKGSEKIALEDIYNPGNSVDIQLKPELDAKSNADYYFEKSKNSRVSFNKSLSLYEDYTKRFQYLKNIQKKLDTIVEEKELINLMKELKMKTEETKSYNEDLSTKFKHYLIEGKYHVYVGKDSKSNDLLTVKFAKQNDYWFHARAVSGSHTILRLDNTKEPAPKSVLKKAASLAAYHSKAKTASVAPVSYTFKKYVVKKKGMDIGQVALLKEDVLLVKPEIPDGCDFISE